jgi:hypothetical protein
MTVIGHGADLCTSTTRPATPSIGSVIYQTDTNEYLTYTNYGGSNRWMQADVKSGRNVITNGGFDVWQRGTSLTGSGGSYGVDMWREYTDTGSGTQSKDTTVYAGNNRASYKWTTGGSASNWSIFQYIETSNCLHMANKKVTLSFWAATSTSRALAAMVYYHTGVDTGWPNSFTLIDTLNFTTSSSLQLFSLTVTVPSNAKTLQVAFGVGTGGNFASGVTVNITGVQLEVGTAPSEFEFEPFETTLRKCQRYFEKTYDLGTAIGAATANGSLGNDFMVGADHNGYIAQRIPFFITKRITNGTLTVYDNAGNAGKVTKYTASGAGINNITPTISDISERAFRIYIVSQTCVGFTTHYTISAEL